MAGENSFSSSLESSPFMAKFVPVVFAHSLSIKLDDINFLLWKQQVGSSIRDHKLQKFILENENPPERFLTARDCVQGKINPSILTGNNKINCSFHGYFLQWQKWCSHEWLGVKLNIRSGKLLRCSLPHKPKVRYLNSRLDFITQRRVIYQ